MKRTNTYPSDYGRILFILLIIVVLHNGNAASQITAALADPSQNIYALTDQGEIFEINTITAQVNRSIKDYAYYDSGPYLPNSLGYNPADDKFYFFLRTRTTNNETNRFVSFDHTTNTFQYLALDSSISITVTGCVTNNGQAYYTVDGNGALRYYSIAANTWTLITPDIVDQNGVDVTNLIKIDKGLTSGDLAVDGRGNLWILLSNATNYAVYKLPAPLPATYSPQLKVTKFVDPSTATPFSGKRDLNNDQIVGIAFNPSGQIFLSSTNKLYLLQDATTTKFIGNINIGTSKVADLTSLNFPAVSALPIQWMSFDARLQGSNTVVLNWEVEEQYNQGFYAETSKDGNSWNDLGFLPAKNIPGAVQHYTYSYHTVLTGIHYYRIRQVDIDGNESFSDTKKIVCCNELSGIMLWPNPAERKFCINNLSDKDFRRLRIFDLSGKLMLTKNIHQGTNAIDISSFSPGIYLVKAGTNKEDFFSYTIIKQ